MKNKSKIWTGDALRSLSSLIIILGSNFIRWIRSIKWIMCELLWIGLIRKIYPIFRCWNIAKLSNIGSINQILTLWNIGHFMKLVPLNYKLNYNLFWNHNKCCTCGLVSEIFQNCQILEILIQYILDIFKTSLTDVPL